MRVSRKGGRRWTQRREGTAPAGLGAWIGAFCLGVSISVSSKHIRQESSWSNLGAGLLLRLLLPGLAHVSVPLVRSLPSSGLCSFLWRGTQSEKWFMGRCKWWESSQIIFIFKKKKERKKRIQQNSWPAGKRPNLSNHLKFIYICTQTLRIIYTFWSSNSTFKNLFQGNNHKYIKWLAIGLSIIVALYNSENQGLPARPATGDCRNYIGPSSGIHGRLSKCCCRSVFLVMVKCSQYDIKWKKIRPQNKAIPTLKKSIFILWLLKNGKMLVIFVPELYVIIFFCSFIEYLSFLK